jgi:nucleotide-binding universal stress UspA family protein
MFEDVLFPTDGSDGASRVLDHVLDLATEHGATVHLLSAAGVDDETLTSGRTEVAAEIESRAHSVVSAAAARADARGVETVTSVASSAPSDAVVDYTEEAGIDLIAMPTHGRTGLERILLGSTTERVVRRSPAPVLALPPTDDSREYPYRRLLAPTDGSRCAETAIELGAGLAAATDARFDVLSIVDVAHLGFDTRVDLQIDQLEENAAKFVDAGSDLAAAAGVAADRITTGVVSGTSPYREINAYVEANDIDLLVVGTHGRTGIDRYLLGSVTEKLLRTSSVPVLTVRAEEEADRDEQADADGQVDADEQADGDGQADANE